MIGLTRRLAQRPYIFRRLSPGAHPAKRVRPSGAKQKCPRGNLLNPGPLVRFLNSGLLKERLCRDQRRIVVCPRGKRIHLPTHPSRDGRRANPAGCRD